MDLPGFLDIPRTALQAALREAVGRRPVLPWIPFAATRAIRKRLRRDWSVLEFGAGMSTIWFAERCATVYSVEHDGAGARSCSSS